MIVRMVTASELMKRVAQEMGLSPLPEPKSCEEWEPIMTERAKELMTLVRTWSARAKEAETGNVAELARVKDELQSIQMREYTLRLDLNAHKDTFENLERAFDHPSRVLETTISSVDRSGTGNRPDLVTYEERLRVLLAREYDERRNFQARIAELEQRNAGLQAHLTEIRARQVQTDVDIDSALHAAELQSRLDRARGSGQAFKTAFETVLAAALDRAIDTPIPYRVDVPTAHHSIGPSPDVGSTPSSRTATAEDLLRRADAVKDRLVQGAKAATAPFQPREG